MVCFAALLQLLKQLQERNPTLGRILGDKNVQQYSSQVSVKQSATLPLSQHWHCAASAYSAAGGEHDQNMSMVEMGESRMKPLLLQAVTL